MPTIPCPKPTNAGPIVPTYPSAAIAITPSDGADDLFEVPVTVYVGVGGNVTIRTAADPTVTRLFSGVPAGSCVPCLARGVMSTGTSATTMVGVY